MELVLTSNFHQRRRHGRGARTWDLLILSSTYLTIRPQIQTFSRIFFIHFNHLYFIFIQEDEDVTHDEIWDDTALIKAYDRAVQKLKVYFVCLFCKQFYLYWIRVMKVETTIRTSLSLCLPVVGIHEHGRLGCKSVIETFTLPIGSFIYFTTFTNIKS